MLLADADFIVKLIDVFPDDFSYGPEAPSASPRIPSETPTIVKFSLPDVAHTFKEGHRIMIQVQSSWFPLVDRNPQQFLNIYECNDEDFKKATIRIFHNKTNLSYIGLPVLN